MTLALYDIYVSLASMAGGYALCNFGHLMFSTFSL